MKNFFFVAFNVIITAFAASPLASDVAVDMSDGLVVEVEAVEQQNGPGDTTAVKDDLQPLMPDVMPSLAKFVKADYPPALIRDNITGTVTLELLVNETGNVDSVKVVGSLRPVLDSAAAAACRGFIFEPARTGNTAVAVLLLYEYRFTLDETIDSLRPGCNFSGICVERGTRRPVADVVVSVAFSDSLCDTSLVLPFGAYLGAIGSFPGQHYDEGRIVTTTDSQGVFRFYSLPACSIIVSAAIPGFEQFETGERIGRGDSISVKYVLERFSYSEYEVLVYGKAKEKEVARHQLSIGEVRKVPGLGGDAVKVLQALPGVSRPVMGSGEIVVRGAPTADSRFFIDGMELPVLYHFGMKSTFNSEALSAIDFYPGGFGTRYGGAIAGIAEIQSRTGTNERIKGLAEFSTLDGSFFVEGPAHDSVTFIASARRSVIGELIRGIFKLFPDQFPFTLYPFYWDYLLKANASAGRAGKFSLMFFGSRDSMSFIFPETRFGSDAITGFADRIGTNTTFHMAVAGWDVEMNEQWKNSARYQLMNIHYLFSSPFGMTLEDIWVNHIRDELTHNFSDRLTLTLGVDAQWSLADVRFASPTGTNAIERDTIDNWRFGDIAAYINLIWKPHDRVQIIPGLRYDYYPELIYNGSVVPAFWDYRSFDNHRGFSGEPSLRLSCRYEFIDRHTAKMALGTYNQTPEPMGMVLMEDFGNPEMPSTKAAQYVIGYEWQINDLFNLDCQAYYNKQWNIPDFVTSDEMASVIDGGDVYKDNGLGRMYGLEIMLRRRQSERFFGWVAYTLSRSERFIRSTDEWAHYYLDETHNLQVLGSWKLRRNWEAGFRLHYVTGKPKTAVVDIVELENNQGGSSIMPVYGEANSSRFDPFFQLDVRVDKKFVFDNLILSVFWDLQYISWLVYKSPEYEIYNYDYTDKMVVSNFPGIAVGLKVEF